MSQWIDRIRDHVVWQQLKSLGPVIDQAEAREGNEPAAIDGLERLRTILGFTGKRLAIADPLLILPAALEGLNGTLQKALSEVQSFITDGNAGHITNANTHADSALAYIAQLYVPIASDDLTIISESAASYRTTLERHLQSASTLSQQLQVEVDGLKAKLSELAKDLNAEHQRMSTISAEQQSQFSAAQEAKNSEFAKTQSERQEKYGALISEHTKRLNDQDLEFARQRDEEIKTYKGELEVLKKDYRESATSIVGEIEEHKGRVEKLVGVIGNLGVTSGYLNTANDAKKKVARWEKVTVISLVFIALFALDLLFGPSHPESFSWEDLAARILLTSALGFLAAYGRNRADKYLKIEQANRKLALELEAIGPFLAPLPQAMQDDFRVNVVGARAFGRDEPNPGLSTDSSPVTPVELLLKNDKFIQLVVDAVKSATKK